MQRISRRLLLITLCLLGGLWLIGGADKTIAAPARQSSEPAPATGQSVQVLAAGDIAKCNLEWDSYTGHLLDINEGPILAVGDLAYDVGSLQEFRDCWGPTWGRNNDRIYPIPGNHEYGTQGAQGYFTYWGDKATPLEPGCTRDCKGYYSFDLGAWHIVALNSEIPSDPGTEQEQWLRADLAAHPAACILAFWHRPAITSIRGGGENPVGLWQALYDYGGDILLSGHRHIYERFTPLDAALQPDPEHGIRQFVVGTGGDDLDDFRAIQPASEARNNAAWGVLKLTLHPDSYDWEFLPISGYTFTDKGSAKCVTPKVQPTYSTPAVAPETTTTTLASTTGTAATVPTGGAQYTIRAGDTLGTIGAQYGLDWSVLAAANGLDAYSILEIGQVIRIPGVDEELAPLVTESGGAETTTAPATTVPAPGTNTTGATETTTSAANIVGKYTVQAGDSLFALATKFGVSVAALAAANNIEDGDFIVIGQVLQIPAPTSTALRLLPTPTPAATSATTGTVRAGRTTTTTVSSTTEATGATGATSAAAPAGAKFHTVASGETIITIALDYDKDWQELLKLNGLEPDSIISIGQQIRIE